MEQCPTHPGQHCELWCRSCDVHICHRCLLHDHPTGDELHAVVGLDLVFSERVQDCTAGRLLTALAARIPVVAAGLANIEAAEQELVQQHKRIKDNIAARYEKTIAAITKSRGLLLEELDQLVKDKATNLTVRRGLFQVKSQQCDNRFPPFVWCLPCVSVNVTVLRVF